MVWRSMQGKEVGQAMEHIVRVQSSLHDDGQASPGELIDHGEHTDLPSIMSTAHDEVIGPNMVGPAGPETDARSVVEPQSAPLGLLARNLEPLPPPEALHPLGVHGPAFSPQQRRNTSVAVSAVLCCQADDRSGQCLFIISAAGLFPLGRAMLTDNRAGAPLGDTQFGL